MARRLTRSATGTLPPKKVTYDVESDDDEIEIVSEKPATRPLVMTFRRKPPQPNIELLMECVEEELSLSQIEAAKRAQKEYNESLTKIKSAEAVNMKAKKLIEKAREEAKRAAKDAVTNGTSSPDVEVVTMTPNLSSPIPVNHLSTAQNTQPIQYQILPVRHSQPQGLMQSALQTNQMKTTYYIHPQQPQQQYRQYPPYTSSIVQQPPMVSLNTYNTGNAPRVSNSLPPPQQSTPKMGRPTTNTNYRYNVVSRTSQPIPPPYPTGSALVSGTNGIGVRLKNNPLPQPGTEGWVSLDTYYYGIRDGDTSAPNEMGEFRFRCHTCQKMFYNNTEVMKHMQGHIDTEKQINLDLSYLTTCKHCYVQFNTPYETQCHTEKVHLNNSSSFLCRICERDYTIGSQLISHMRTTHKKQEMPYICGICGFRSSFYADVLDHFKKKHDGTDCVLCMYCLRVFKLRVSSAGHCSTKVYMDHLARHMVKNSVRKCNACKLTFCNKHEQKRHRLTEHESQVSSSTRHGGSALASGNDVMIQLNNEGKPVRAREYSDKDSTPVKSLNASRGNLSDLKSLQLPSNVNMNKCFECGTLMGLTDHYRKYVECNRCRYATFCSKGYANHMTKFHSAFKCGPKSKALPYPTVHCICGFSTMHGNKMANHLVECGNFTAYTVKPDPTKTIKKEPPTIFDILGLVKKPEIDVTWQNLDDPPVDDSFSDGVISEQTFSADDSSLNVTGEEKSTMDIDEKKPSIGAAEQSSVQIDKTVDASKDQDKQSVSVAKDLAVGASELQTEVEMTEKHAGDDGDELSVDVLDQKTDEKVKSSEMETDTTTIDSGVNKSDSSNGSTVVNEKTEPIKNVEEDDSGTENNTEKQTDENKMVDASVSEQADADDDAILDEEGAMEEGAAALDEKEGESLLDEEDVSPNTGEVTDRDYGVEKTGIETKETVGNNLLDSTPSVTAEAIEAEDQDEADIHEESMTVGKDKASEESQGQEVESQTESGEYEDKKVGDDEVKESRKDNEDASGGGDIPKSAEDVNNDGGTAGETEMTEQDKTELNDVQERQDVNNALVPDSDLGSGSSNKSLTQPEDSESLGTTKDQTTNDDLHSHVKDIEMQSQTEQDSEMNSNSEQASVASVNENASSYVQKQETSSMNQNVSEQKDSADKSSVSSSSVPKLSPQMGAGDSQGSTKSDTKSSTHHIVSPQHRSPPFTQRSPGQHKSQHQSHRDRSPGYSRDSGHRHDYDRYDRHDNRDQRDNYHNRNDNRHRDQYRDRDRQGYHQDRYQDRNWQQNRNYDPRRDRNRQGGYHGDRHHDGGGYYRGNNY